MLLSLSRRVSSLAVLLTVAATGAGAAASARPGDPATATLAAASAPAAAAPSPLSTAQACPAGEVPEAWMVDVPSSAVGADAVNCLAWWKVAVGDGSFHYRPAAAVSRGAMALFLTRLIRLSGGQLATATRDYFPDDNGTVYEQADNDLAQAGIVSGLPDGDFAPTAPVTRAQMAKFLYDAYTYRVSGTVSPAPTAQTSDFSDVPIGAVFADDIMAIAADGFAGGYPDGTYQPAGDVTRAQMALFLTRVLEKAVTDAGAGLPAAPAPRAGVASYVADGTSVYLHSLTGAAADTLVYTAPTGDTVTATALSPDGSRVAVAYTRPATAGSTPTDTGVVVVPAGGGSPVSVDDGTLATDVVVHLSWHAQLLASAVTAAGLPTIYQLNPAGSVAPVAIGGSAGTQCRWAESLPVGAVVYSGCASAAGGVSVVLGSPAGAEYGPLSTAAAAQLAVPSPLGNRLALITLDVSPTAATSADVSVAPSVLGAATSVVSVPAAAGSSSLRTVDAVGWANATTLLYSTINAASSGGGPTGGSVWSVPASGGAAPTALSLSGTEQWGVSSLPSVG